jgi:hypothetical protein
MIVLDTDHLSILQHAESAIAARLIARLDATSDRDVVTTPISFEEQMRGWLAEVRRKKSPRDEVPVYGRLGGLFRFYAGWRLLRSIRTRPRSSRIYAASGFESARATSRSRRSSWPGAGRRSRPT